MILDIEKYLPHLERFDLSREEKESVLRTLWGIVESCVNQAFQKHPVQQACDDKKKNLQIRDHSIDSKNQPMHSQFKQAVKGRHDGES